MHKHSTMCWPGWPVQGRGQTPAQWWDPLTSTPRSQRCCPKTDCHESRALRQLAWSWPHWWCRRRTDARRRRGDKGQEDKRHQYIYSKRENPDNQIYTFFISLPTTPSLRFLPFEILLKFCCAFTCTTNLDYSDICWAGLQTETGNEKCGKGNPDCGISRGWAERKMMDWNTVRSDNNTCIMKAEPPLCRLNPVNAGQPQTDSPLTIQVQHHTFWFDTDLRERSLMKQVNN